MQPITVLVVQVWGTKQRPFVTPSRTRAAGTGPAHAGRLDNGMPCCTPGTTTPQLPPIASCGSSSSGGHRLPVVYRSAGDAGLRQRPKSAPTT